MRTKTHSIVARKPEVKCCIIPHIACISRDSDYCITKYKPNLVIEQRSRVKFPAQKCL